MLKKWRVQSCSNTHLLCMGIIIIVHIGSLKPNKNWSVSTKKTYDFFAIKITDITSGMTVGHLPMENSRVSAILTSTNYCVSPLVEGGLEIPCRIEIHMPPTVKNKELIRIYESHVDTLYYEREEANIVDSFESEEVPLSVQGELRKLKKKMNAAMKNKKQESTKNIRSYFLKVGSTTPTLSKSRQTDSNNVVELSD